MTNFLGTFKLLYTAKEGISKMDDSSEKSALLKQRDKELENMRLKFI